MKIAFLILALAATQTRVDLATQVKGIVCPANQVAQWNGGAWVCTAVTGGGSGGTVTSVGSGTGLTGGPITGSGTLALITPVAVANGGTGTSSPGLVSGSNVTITGSWPNQTINSTTGGGNPALENCSPDQTGNSFYSVTSLSNYFYASWQFIFATATYINCTVFVPAAQTGATIILDIAANDATAGHTASFQTCDGVINSGTINTGSLTCAAAQTFTTTSTAYNRVSLTFNVQSTLANGSMLAIKILTSTSGTAPTANMLVYPHFVL